MKYQIDIMDFNSLCRAKELLDNLYRMMEILNKDSEESPHGGAMMYYKLHIDVEEEWG